MSNAQSTTKIQEEVAQAQGTASQDTPATASSQTTSADSKSKPKGKSKTQYVRSLVGDMRHLVTDEMITSHEKRIEVDAFAQAQIDSGKWEIVNPD